MINVLLVSDVRLLGHAVGEILVPANGMALVATAHDTNTAIGECRRHRPDVVLLDLSMPDWQKLARTLVERLVRLVALAVPKDERAVQDCVGSGLQGLVCREAGAEELQNAILSVESGASYCDPRIGVLVMRCLSAKLIGGSEHSLRHGALRAQAEPFRALAHPRSPGHPALTPREWEIANLLCSGFPNKGIARELGIEVSTVKNHVHSILAKTGAASRTEAVCMLGAC